ncbi:SphA family protein [Herbaspirillum camelliae]|uniref:SphA family protein n=1 Tax=Herbaspirillum camelliae TaxID=1892903 RepID=UPI001E299498|nr:transporter [Herbaspirillum camelliae]
MKTLTRCGMILLAASLLPLSHATEGGGSTYFSGADNFLLGAVPPPGLYVLQFGNVYSSTRLNDDNGNAKAIPGFSVHSKVLATRIVWSTPYQLLGGNLVMHTILPVVNLSVDAAGSSQTKTGLGDITFGPAVANHYSAHLHSVYGFDLVAPTGAYNKNDLANIGRNYWSLQPLLAMSYIDKDGFNGDFKATFNINQTNSASHYRSGTEFNLDYAAGYSVARDWVAGISGYWYRQIADDEQQGANLSGTRGRAFAIGPSVKYDNGRGFVLTAKIQREMAVSNRTQGTALALRASIPF